MYYLGLSTGILAVSFIYIFILFLYITNRKK